MEASALLGSWKLVEWRAISERDAGSVAITYPMGKGAHGLIHYGSDARMSVLIAAAGRKPFATDDLVGGTVDERAAALATFIAYAGSYTVGDDRVTHHIEICSFPNWVGTQQVRYVAFEGDQLILSTGSIPTSGALRRSELAWARIPDSR